MRHLILMRHGKAESPSASGDHARGLTIRGRGEAAEAGRRIAALVAVDSILLSDSRRTRDTVECVGTALPPGAERRVTRALYAASPEGIMAEVAATSDDVETLLVVGHNPGIADLARRLAGAGDPADLDRLREGFPTSCFAVLSADLQRWRDPPPPYRLTFLLPRHERSGL